MTVSKRRSESPPSIKKPATWMRKLRARAQEAGEQQRLFRIPDSQARYIDGLKKRQGIRGRAAVVSAIIRSVGDRSISLMTLPPETGEKLRVVNVLLSEERIAFVKRVQKHFRVPTEGIALEIIIANAPDPYRDPRQIDIETYLEEGDAVSG